jgi:hypothetical protein
MAPHCRAYPLLGADLVLFLPGGLPLAAFLPPLALFTEAVGRSAGGSSSPFIGGFPLPNPLKISMAAGILA